MGAIEAYHVHSGPLGEDVDLPHPGEALDPWGLDRETNTFAEPKTKEIRKGRLAIPSIFSYYVHAVVSGNSSFAMWASHIADPFAVSGMISTHVIQLAPSFVAILAATSSPYYGPGPSEVVRRLLQWFYH